MTPFPVRIGIDEIATETQKCDGFTFFCLPERYADEFSEKARALLSSTKMKAFHAKEYKRRFRAAYKQFVQLIFEYLKKSPQCLIVCRLFSQPVKMNLSSCCSRAVEKAVGTKLGMGHSTVEMFQPYFWRLACLAAISRELAPEVLMNVEMGTHSSLRSLDASVHESLDDRAETAVLLRDFYNDYARNLHERTPLLPDEGVKVLDDADSMLIQAADIFGNFAMAHMSVLLGKGGKATVAKSEILTEVMGDEAGVFDPARKLRFEGGTLVLTQDGSITFRVAASITKPPDDPKLIEDWPQDDGFLGKG